MTKGIGVSERNTQEDFDMLRAPLDDHVGTRGAVFKTRLITLFCTGLGHAGLSLDRSPAPTEDFETGPMR